MKCVFKSICLMFSQINNTARILLFLSTPHIQLNVSNTRWRSKTHHKSREFKVMSLSLHENSLWLGSWLDQLGGAQHGEIAFAMSLGRTACRSPELFLAPTVTLRWSLVLNNVHGSRSCCYRHICDILMGLAGQMETLKMPLFIYKSEPLWQNAIRPSGRHSVWQKKRKRKVRKIRFFTIINTVETWHLTGALFILLYCDHGLAWGVFAIHFLKKKNFNSKTHKYTLAFVIGLGILEILIIIANQDLRFITIIQSSFHINNFI